MQMKNPKKVYILILITILVCSIFVNIVQAVTETTNDPGSDGDPIVSKSYVDTSVNAQAQQLQLLQDKYNQLLQEMETLKTQTSAAGAKGFELVSLDIGQKLLAGNGTEIILRTGKGTSIKGKSGGLLDTNTVKELLTTLTISPNHLLLSVGDDGRGITAVTKSQLIIRGAYKIEEKEKDAPVVKPDPNVKPDPVVKPNSPEKFIGTGLVVATSLNVREKADVNSKKLTGLIKGQSVLVVATSGEWSKIKTAEGIYGWTLSKYISIKK